MLLKKKILFVNAVLESNTPRTIRTLNFVKHLKDKHEIHVLYFKFKKDKLKIPGAIVHTIELKNFFKRKFIVSKSKNILFRLLYKLNNFPNKLKDVFYFDIKNLSKKIEILDSEFQFNKVIISISPFSLFKLSNHLSLKNTTFDVGDHLYKNSAVLKFDNKYYYKIEKNALLKCNTVIVTNVETKKFYIDNYHIDSNKIDIIPQGFDEEFINELNDRKLPDRYQNGVIRLVYGGQFYKGLRDPTFLVKAIQNFNKKNSSLQIQFDIYGGGGININEGNGVSKLPYISQKELFEQIINSDYNVFIDNCKGIQTPGKIFENLALRTPILFIKSPITTKTFELINNCNGIKFVLNEFEQISNLLENVKKNDNKIICDFDLTLWSWKKLSLKINIGPN